MRSVVAAGLVGAMCALGGGVAAAGQTAQASEGWYEPQRGTAERAALMDALRSEAETLFGAPVEFVVDDLRVSGDLAFASVTAQRPGGAAIALETTPGWLAGAFADASDAMQGQALYQRSEGAWVTVIHVFGATDVWWSDPQLCATFRAVTADVC